MTIFINCRTNFNDQLHFSVTGTSYFSKQCVIKQIVSVILFHKQCETCFQEKLDIQSKYVIVLVDKDCSHFNFFF